jgi:Fic family protein
MSDDQKKLLARADVTIPVIRLYHQLPVHPMITLPRATELLKTSKPTASKAITVLTEANVLRETTGRERDRVYAYHSYLLELTREAD